MGKTAEKTATQVMALGVIAGIPVYLEGPPGDGKTSLKRAVLEVYGYRVIELVAADLSPERVAGYPVPVLERGVVRYVPDETMGRLKEGGYGLVVSEVNTAPPETVSAVLEMIRVGRVAGETHTVPILLSANPDHQAVGATPLGPAFANRVLRLEYRGELASQVWVMRRAAQLASELAQRGGVPGASTPRELFDALEGRAWREYLVQEIVLPPFPTPEDAPSLLLAQAKARRLVANFVQAAQPKLETPPPDLHEAFRPYLTRRSLSMATAFISAYLWAEEKGWTPSEDVLVIGLMGLVGERVGPPLAAYVLESADIPTPEEVLANPRLFPTRADKAAALGAAIVSYLDTTGDYERGIAVVEALLRMGRKEEAVRLLAGLTKAAKAKGKPLRVPVALQEEIMGLPRKG